MFGITHIRTIKGTATLSNYVYIIEEVTLKNEPAINILAFYSFVLNLCCYHPHLPIDRFAGPILVASTKKFIGSVHLGPLTKRPNVHPKDDSFTKC